MKHLERAACLLTVLCIRRARNSSRIGGRALPAMRGQGIKPGVPAGEPTTLEEKPHMTAPADPNIEAATELMRGELHELMLLDEEGKPLHDGTEEGAERVIETEGRCPELIRVGMVAFTIVDHDAHGLAQSIDVIGHELPVVCVRVAFEPDGDEPIPMSGSLIRIAPDGAWTDVEVWFRVATTFDDLAAPNPFAEQGRAWTHAGGLIDVLKDGEALLVQVLDIEQEVA